MFRAVPPPRSEQRFTQRPWIALAVMSGGFLLGALLNATPLADTAASQPVGWGRTAALAATDAVSEVSDALFLDEPHQLLTEWLDRTTQSVPSLPAAPGERFTPSASRPLRMWVAGDSLTETIGAAVVNSAAETDVVAASFDVQYSSGLARPELFDWRREVGERLIVAPADIVVFMLGANDAQAVETATGFVAFGKPEWIAEYRTRVDAVMSALAASAVDVYWIGLPQAADEARSERFATINAVYRAAADAQDRIHFIDIFTEFADPDGNYTAMLADPSGRLIRVRDPDGIHFTPAGADLVAQLVLDEIAAGWALGG